MIKIFSLIGLIIYFAVLLFVVMKEKKNENALDYFFANRKLPFWMLSITFIASWWGAGSAISTADLAFYDGVGAFWCYGAPVLISTFLMIIFSKPIRNVGYLTQGKMIEARYSKKVAKFLSVMIVTFMIFNAASQMVGMGMLFGEYLDLNYELAVIIGTGVVLIYSLFGGFKGVVITDVIQFFLLVISAFLVFGISLHEAGGFKNIYAFALSTGSPNYFNFFSGLEKYSMYVITFGCAWMIQANVWQRISATKNNKDAKNMTVLSFFLYIPLYLIVVFTGMAGKVLFKDLPEGGIVISIVSNYMSPLVGSVVFIGLSAAIMSTMDSLINTGAMTIVLDLLPDSHSEKSKLKFSKYATIFVTLISIAIALKINSILEIAWIASDIITTGLFIPIILGFIWKKGNSNGALSSMIFGLIYCSYNFFISIGFRLPSFWEQQSASQVLIGIIISFLVFILVSLFTKTDYNKSINFIKLAGFKK